MPIVVGLIAAAAGAGFSALAAHESASGAESAATTSAAATTHGADLAAKANADALAFQKQQAEQTYQQQEATRKANYGQYSSLQEAQNQVRQQMGLPPLPIPEYSPLPAPNYTGSTPAGPTTATAGAPSTAAAPSSGGNPTDPAFIQSQLQQVYAQHGKQPTGPGTGPTDIAYYTQKILETGGWQGGNANYWTSRIAQDLSGAGSSASSTSKPSPFTSTLPSPTSAMTPPAMPNALPATLQAQQTGMPQDINYYLALMGQGR